MGKIITFAQQKGGAGKTTLLAGLAHALVLKGKSVAAADLDPQGSLRTWASLGGIEKLQMIETASYRVGGDLRSAKAAHDFVLVDCPGSATPLLEAAIRESDCVIVPCQASQVDVWATQAVLDMCAAENTPCRVVLNRVPPRGKAADETRRSLAAAGAKVMKAQVGNRVAFANGLASGSTVLGLPGQARAKDELAAFTKEVLKAL